MWARFGALSFFYGKRHPNEPGAPEVEAFLTHPAINEHVAASPQNRVLSALLSLPDSLGRQHPNSQRAWAWQYVLPSARLSDSL
jgi:hypothetical protein